MSAAVAGAGADSLESELAAELASMTRLDDAELNFLDENSDSANSQADELFDYSPKATLLTHKFDELMNDELLDYRDYSNIELQDQYDDQPNQHENDTESNPAAVPVSSDSHERWADKFADEMKEFHELNKEAEVEVSQLRTRKSSKLDQKHSNSNPNPNSNSNNNNNSNSHLNLNPNPIESLASQPIGIAADKISNAENFSTLKSPRKSAEPNENSNSSTDPQSFSSVLHAAAIRRAVDRESIIRSDLDADLARQRDREASLSAHQLQKELNQKKLESAMRESENLKEKLKEQKMNLADEKERKMRILAEKEKSRVKTEFLRASRLRMSREDESAQEIRRKRAAKLKLESQTQAMNKRRDNIKRLMGEDRRSAAVRQQKREEIEKSTAIRIKFESMQAAKRAAELAAAAAEKAERRLRQDRERLRCEDDRARRWLEFKYRMRQLEEARLQAVESERIRQLKIAAEENIKKILQAEEEKKQKIRLEMEEKARKIREFELEKLRRIREIEERKAAQHRVLLIRAAIVGQKLWRGRIARLRLPYCRQLKQSKARRIFHYHRKLYLAAAKIQSVVRGFLIRSRFSRVRRIAAAGDSDGEELFDGLDESFYQIDELPEFEFLAPPELLAALNGETKAIPIPPHQMQRSNQIQNQYQYHNQSQYQHHHHHDHDHVAASDPAMKLNRFENNFIATPNLPQIVNIPNQRFDSAKSDRSVSSSGSIQILNSPRYSDSPDSHRSISSPRLPAIKLPSSHAQSQMSAIRDISSAWGISDPRTAAAILKKQQKLKKMQSAKLKLNLTAEQRMNNFARKNQLETTKFSAKQPPPQSMGENIKSNREWNAKPPIQ